MSDVIDLSNGQGEAASAGTFENGTTNGTTGSASSPKEKRMGQLTFDDYENIEQVDPSQDMYALSLGLRRSKRVHQPRSDKDTADIEEEEAAAAARSRRAKAAIKAKAKAKERERLAKIKEKEKQKAKATALKKAAKQENAKNAAATTAGKKSLNGSKPPIVSELYEPPLTDSNWTPNMPLYSSDFKTHHSIISRLKNPNMRSVPYAGDIVKLMSFLNKFYQFFDPELLNLSFQDFEVGLDLYPDDSLGTASGTVDETMQRTLLYQDYIPVKEVVACQDKMNLLFLTLLRLTFSTSKSNDIQKTHQPQATLNQLKSSKKLFANLVGQLRSNAKEWGYPREWRSESIKSEDFLKPKSKLFDVDEDNEPVDPKNPDILTKNIYTWHHHEPLALDEDPLQTPELERNGVLALEPQDRIILLRALIDWCAAQSPKIRNEIHHLSHLKRDPTFGIQTQHAPRYLVEGAPVTFAQFKKLCSIVQSRYEIRSKKKHIKKQLESGKRETLSSKLNLLKELKATLKSVPKEEKESCLVSLYDKWCHLFEGELIDNPLSNPFEDEVYKLRQQEFFVGRVPHIGDFYLPRLHTYPGSPIISTYLDLRNLKVLFEKYSKGEIDVFTLFENQGQNMSSQFKLLYRDTPSLIRDLAQGRSTSDKTYWYEMCHDTKTLQEFLEFLDYKIATGERKPEIGNASNGAEVPSQINQSQQADPELPLEKQDNGIVSEESHAKQTEKEDEADHDKSLDSKSSSTTNKNPVSHAKQIEKEDEVDGDKSLDSKSSSTLNKNPLPKEARFNSARNKLRFLKDYLSEMLCVLRVFEQLKEQYGDMKPGKRLLRRSQRRTVNYGSGYGSDVDDVDVDMGEEYVDDNEERNDSEEPNQDENDENGEYERASKRARVERRDARTSRRSARW